MVPAATTSNLEEAQLDGSSPIFQNVLILDNVCNWLPFQDLLNVSFVNRLWRGSARRGLRKRRCFFSLHNLDNDLCQHLTALNELLKTSADIPFAGFCGGRYLLERNACSEDKCLRVGDQAPPQLFSELLHRIEFKFLRIGPPSDLCIPVVTFMEEILKYKGKELEELEIAHYDRYEQLVQHGEGTGVMVQLHQLDLDFVDEKTLEPLYNLPKLKTVTVPPYSRILETPDISELVRSLLIVAPNLERLLGESGTSYDEKIVSLYPKRMLHTITELRYNILTMDYIIRILEAQPKLLKVTIDLGDYDLADPIEKIEYASGLLLTSSYDSMTHLSCDVFVLLYFATGFELNCFRSMKALNICWRSVTIENNVDYTLEQQLSMLALIDLDAIFPSMDEIVLDKTRITCTPDSIIEKHLRGVLAQDKFHQCLNVTKLSIDPVSIKVRIVAHIFPNVRTLNMLNLCPSYIPSIVTSCWDSIDTIVDPVGIPNNFVKIMFGLSEEELAVYKDWDEESLKRLNLVPCGYSILSKNVTTLKIYNFREFSKVETSYQELFPKGLLNLLRAKVPGFTFVFREIQTFRCRDSNMPEELKEFRPEEISKKAIDVTKENPSFYFHSNWPPADSVEWTARL